MKKSDSRETIQHDGIVKKVDSNSVIVSITSSSACSGCHAEGICGISGKEEKIVDIKGKYNVSTGDPVTILMQQSTGYKAVVLSYLIPLVILISSLIVLSSFSISELISGLAAISLLVPYFLILYLFRKKINRSFTFMLKT
jgi:sigma-E factor negative regulatory protein RseC